MELLLGTDKGFPIANKGGFFDHYHINHSCNIRTKSRSCCKSLYKHYLVPKGAFACYPIIMMGLMNNQIHFLLQYICIDVHIVTDEDQNPTVRIF